MIFSFYYLINMRIRIYFETKNYKPFETNLAKGYTLRHVKVQKMTPKDKKAWRDLQEYRAKYDKARKV